MTEVDSGSELKKCPIFSVLPGMTGGQAEGFLRDSGGFRVRTEKMSHFFSSARNDRRRESFVTAVDSGSELKKCPIFSVLPGMTGGGHFYKIRAE
ncbi:hypothetical protein QUF72_03260 [Desulfobacterales bacterium HSG2]|nr:hypothetical protein [Desulfobacterales bacterium HSG2]